MGFIRPSETRFSKKRSMPRDWRFRVDDILDAISKIERYVEGKSQQEFAANELTVDAVLRNLEVIGEAARFIPDAIAAR